MISPGTMNGARLSVFICRGCLPNQIPRLLARRWCMTRCRCPGMCMIATYPCSPISSCTTTIGMGMILLQNMNACGGCHDTGREPNATHPRRILWRSRSESSWSSGGGGGPGERGARGVDAPRLLAGWMAIPPSLGGRWALTRGGCG